MSGYPAADALPAHARKSRDVQRMHSCAGQAAALAAAIASLPARQAYLDGELCGTRFRRKDLL